MTDPEEATLTFEKIASARGEIYERMKCGVEKEKETDLRGLDGAFTRCSFSFFVVFPSISDLAIRLLDDLIEFVWPPPMDRSTSLRLTFSINSSRAAEEEQHLLLAA